MSAAATTSPGHCSCADVRFMRQALELSERGRRTAAPNPWVGAVIVGEDGETVLGVGFHHGPGQPHAEVGAFRDAEARGFSDFSGATLYTTLEPCHRGPGKRTPPCDELLVAKRVKRCVVGHVDPDPSFGGAGVEFLRSNGIVVDVGPAGEEIRRSLRSYLFHRRTGLPFTVAKIAMSLDGRVACADKTSQWITQAAARQDAHRLRADSQAIMVGSGTALADRPSLTVRLEREAGPPVPPLRAVLDTRGKVLEGPLLDTKLAPTLIFTCKDLCSPEAYAKWRECGVEYCEVPLEKDSAHLDLRSVLQALAKRGVLQLMVEGGAVLQGSLLRAGLCEELRIYFGATLLGATAQSWAQAELTKTIKDAQFWRLSAVRQLEEDVCLEYERKQR